MSATKVNDFLRKSNELLETSTADLKAVKTNLKIIHKAEPSLVDPEIFERLSRIADNIEIAKDARARVDALAVTVEKQQKTIDSLILQINELKNISDLVQLNKRIAEKLGK